MEKIKEILVKFREILIKIINWKFITLIIIFLVIGLTVKAFYLIKIKPSHIISNCHEIAQKAAIKEYSSYEGNTSFRPDEYELYYKQCLRSKGINK